MNPIDAHDPKVHALVGIDELHACEERNLAGYAMHSRNSRGRVHPEADAPFRTCYQRDRDRIIHSTAFRRLEYKTQVFVNHEGDLYRTRLTHTLEVAQIARSIARSLRLNEDLVEAVALAHDLGHSPFGHAGEEALSELMADDGGFNHNVQSLRVVDRLEKRYPEFDGLNLTWEVRESIVKHGDHDFGEVGDAFEPDDRPLLEAQLADIADSLAYDNHDIDDGVRSEFITARDLREIPLWCEAEEAVQKRYDLPSDSSLLVARTVSHLIDTQIRDLLESTLARIEARGIRTVEDVRRQTSDTVGFSAEMTAKKCDMQDFLRERLYRHHRALKMTEKAKRFIAEIFTEYRRNPRQLPPSFQTRIEADGAARVICDYVAGMTDRYCQEEYKRLFHPFERV